MDAHGMSSRTNRPPRVVIKAGGNVGSEATAATVAAVRKLREYGVDVVLVHGGGPQISGWLERLGIPARFHAGRRITDQQTIEVTEMVLSGTVNKAWVAALAAEDIPAIGISGRDGDLITARPRQDEGTDLGQVGIVDRIDPTALERLLAAGFCPVVSPLSSGPGREPFNVNADEAAAAVAVAINASALLLLTDVPGLLRNPSDPTSLIEHVNSTMIAELVAEGTIAGGMQPKLEAASAAANGGVAHVRLVDGTDSAALSQATAWLLAVLWEGTGGEQRAPGTSVVADFTDHWLERGRAVLIGNYGRLPLVLAAGDGAVVRDVDGNAWLDFVGGLAVNALGHGHPAIAAALAEQAHTMIHCSNLYWIPRQIELAERLSSLTGMERWFFCNSGTEANEAAIKLARRWGIQNRGPEAYEIISTTGSFHGRTFAALTATGQQKHQQGFGPLVDGFRYVPYGDSAAIAAAINDRTCAVLVEPIQGEGGVNMPPPGYLRELREICDRHGILLMFDEVQTGIGRTGKWLACHHEDVLPDVVSLAKALANGVPIGAIGTRGVASTVLAPGTHASTFGGNPLACVAALATLDVIVEQNLLGHAARLGSIALARLRSEGAQIAGDKFVEARGRGLMLGLVLKNGAARVAEDCRQRGLLVNAIGDEVIRLLPPLIISEATLHQGLDILLEALGLP